MINKTHQKIKDVVQHIDKSSESHNANFKNGQDGFVERNKEKLKAFRSWVIWYPDLYLDLIKPQTGALNLHLDQRIFMRCDARFWSMYGCFPRGYGKTFDEVAIMMVTCIAYPGIDLSLSAQTKENAAKMLSEKYNDIIRWYPALENEVLKVTFRDNYAKISFKNLATIDITANSGGSKGIRKKRLRIEESALLNNEIFEDALKPTVAMPRYTCGKLAVVDPCELNQQIHFFTTPGWRQSDEHKRSLDMYENMINLKGTLVLGSDWMLPCWYGRGSPKSQILEEKRTMNSIAFDQNYGGCWTGATNGALVSINSLVRCRTLTEPMFDIQKDDEIYMGVDVARSQNEANNQSSIAIVRVRRNKKTNRVVSIELGNLFNISNTMNYTNQAIEVKRTKAKYKAKIVIVDGNGLGSGLVDELLKDTIDPLTGESLGCFDTVNTTNVPEDCDAEACVFDMKAQSYQTKVISHFINAVDSGMLRLLESKQYDSFESQRSDDYQEKFMPYLQTDFLFNEITNLKLESNGKALSLKKELSKVDKDRFSALAYVIFYICEFENMTINQAKYSVDDIFMFRAPDVRR